MDCVVTPLKTLMGFSVHLNVQLKFYNLPAKKIVYVQEDLYCYRLTDDSVMSEYLTVTKIADLLRTIEENILDLTFSGHDIQHQKQLYANYLATFAEYFESREMQTHPLYRKIKLRQFELGR